MSRASSPPRGSSARSRLFLALLAASALTRCSCEEETDFTPGATFTPTDVDFGPVSVASEKTVVVRVRSDGGGAYKIAAAVLEADQEKFRFRLDPALSEGLALGRTATIAVTYRPCPAAWDGDVLRRDFDFDGCPTGPEAGDLKITDNSREQSRTLGLSGQPVQPPVATLFCASGGSRACNTDPGPNDLRECNGISFGTVAFDDPPCDQTFEIRNTLRRDRPVGDLVIERFEVKVREINDDVTVDGAQAGFELLDAEGRPLAVDAANPFVVSIPVGGTVGARRFKLRFKGSRVGTWRGEARDETGLRLFTSDPDKRVLSAPLTAIGSAPEIELFPPFVDFGPVEQGRSRTATVTLSNVGDAALRISDMRIAGGNPEFTFRTQDNRTNFELASNASVQVFATYTPRDTGVDQDDLATSSNDPDEPVARLQLRGGAVPRLVVDPSDTLIFPLSDPPPPEREETIVISNAGFGDLDVSQLDIVGPEDRRDHPSVDDFTIVMPGRCSSLPCDPGFDLCPPSNPGCTSSEARIVVRYRNNDISTTDLATLVINSNDPADPVHRVVLNATDQPCLFPTPIITVETPRPCVGQPVRVTASASNPGGPVGMVATLTSFQWAWLFTPGQAPAFTPMDAETVSFTPTRDGVHTLGLNVTNSCGARSQSTARETLNISATCPE
jgi:hypothetical protein